MFLTAEFASKIKSSELRISFSVISLHYNQWRGITSSQPRFALHNSWFNNFSWSRNGSARHSGSYTELIIDSNPLLVIGFRFKVTLNQKLLVSVFQSTPKAGYDGRSPTKSLSFIPFLLSFSGMDRRTLLLLLRNFVSLKPPDKHVALKFFIS